LWGVKIFSLRGNTIELFGIWNHSKQSNLKGRIRKEKDMTLTELDSFLAEFEKKKVQVNIAQIKEIRKLLLCKLAEMPLHEVSSLISRQFKIYSR
jgi:hypothetical protein